MWKDPSSPTDEQAFVIIGFIKYVDLQLPLSLHSRLAPIRWPDKSHAGARPMKGDERNLHPAHCPHADVVAANL